MLKKQLPRNRSTMATMTTDEQHLQKFIFWSVYHSNNNDFNELVEMNRKNKKLRSLKKIKMDTPIGRSVSVEETRNALITNSGHFRMSVGQLLTGQINEINTCTYECEPNLCDETSRRSVEFQWICLSRFIITRPSGWKISDWAIDATCNLQK